MRQFNLIKHFKTAMVAAIVLLTIGFISSCSDSSTNSTDTKDSTNVTDTAPVDTNRVDTTKGDQVLPPKNSDTTRN